MTSAIITLAETAAHESGPAIHPYAVGAIALGILLTMLLGVLMFGAGREHS